MKTNEKQKDKLANDIGGYKQISFWNTMVRIIYRINIVLTIIGVVVGIGVGIYYMISASYAQEANARSFLLAIPIVLGCLAGGALLIFIQYLLLMLYQLLLSYFYDIKQQRITLERIADKN